MNTHADKTQENKSRAVANSLPKLQSNSESTFQFMDNRPETIAQLKLQEAINNSPRVKQLKAYQEMANNSLSVKQTTQLHTTIQEKETSFYQPVKQPTTLIGEALIGTAAAIGLGYAMYRRSGITVNLQDVQGQLANGRLEAAVLVQATGLKEGDWVDYQISWAQGAVPGFNGLIVVNPHLGQQAGQAGGWRTDQPPPGNQNPFVRNPANHRYVDQGDGTTNFQFIDEIQQDVNMVQGPHAQRRWWFRAIVKNSWGIPIKMSNNVMIQWP